MMKGIYKMKNIMKLMRVKHYIKNCLIFLPIFFSQKTLGIDEIFKVILGFISFSLISSCIYILNDICDVDKDRNHPTKKDRPIASGEVSIRNAYLLAIALFIVSLIINYISSGFNFISFGLLLLYFVLNVLYSLGLKNIALVDIVILVSGFLIRLLYGAEIVDVHISHWLYLTVMSMAFYLGLGKRRNELGNQGLKTRSVLKKYNYEFLDKNMYLCLCLTIVFYSLWCIDPNIVKLHPQLLWTIPLVLVICMKYSLTIEGQSSGDPVDVVLNDKMLMSLIFIYGIVITWFFYGTTIIGLFRL